MSANPYSDNRLDDRIKRFTNVATLEKQENLYRL